MARESLDNPLFDADDIVDAGGVPSDAMLGPDGEQPILLSAEDLLPAADGSVIFEADVPFAIQLAGGRSVVDSGIAAGDAQADGEPVAGYRYIALDDGVTLFYPPETSLVLVEG